MDIKPYDKTIRELFGSGRQFFIPRFQREYSWEKKNYKEFFEDMMDNLVILDGKISSSQYFLGTMLFVGDFAEGTEKEIQVVDGQQRLTTITIFFSALSDKFIEINQRTLSKQIFKYIMTKNDDGDDVRILKSKTHYPFFANFIQDRSKNIEQVPNSEEESCIKYSYDYYFQWLSEEKLKTILKRKHVSDSVDLLTFVDILKALRDQVLNSTFVSISTKDRTQANKIFEILNAKGKHLAYIDLIKNKIFEILKEQEPADFAENTWGNIKNVLNSGAETVGIGTYYRHYWISKYRKSYSSSLYDHFNAHIPKKEFKYREFLNDMLTNSINYMKIVNPKREDYNNRKEYFWLVQSLNAINNYFNIVQVRIALLALYDLKERNIIDLKSIKETVLYLENFHFAYNAVVAGRSNKLENIYSTFAIAFRRCSNKLEATDIITDKLFAPLDALLPTYDEFRNKFAMLAYSKKDDSLNVKTKYAINKLNCFYSNKEIFEDDGSIEHLVPETKGIHAQNIGNLILLEQEINLRAGSKDYKDKIADYEASDYNWIKKFVIEYPEWDDANINERATKMAKTYYVNILRKTIT